MGQANLRLTLRAGGRRRSGVPMSVELPACRLAAARLVESPSGREVACQVLEGRLWWVIDDLPAGTTREYAVQPLPAEPAPAGERGVRLEQTDDDRIDIGIGGQPFTSYVFAPSCPGGHEIHRPYFFPVFGPGQVTMTRPFPLTREFPAHVQTDHPHHTSIWVAHGDVSGVDNWSAEAKAGWQVHRGFEAVVSGPAVGMFRETLDWTTADRRPVLAETRTARIWRLPADGRMLDLEVAFGATCGAVVFGDTKEGGLCATRMRTEFRADEHGVAGVLVNSAGQSGEAAWGKPGQWVDCAGQVGELRLGYAIFDAPDNPRHPTTWHARTYGLLTANPFGWAAFQPDGPRGDLTLPADGRLTFRYRLYFHAGDAEQADVAGRYVDYAQPPAAEWG